MKQFPRIIKPLVIEMLHQMPAVFINGPRQAGKSTLVNAISKQINADYLTFDDLATKAAAEIDPQGFVRRLTKPVILDEVQLVPAIFRAIKLEIDEQRLKSGKDANGRFLLTGSTNIAVLPELSEALVGRISVLTLFPLSCGEALSKNVNFLEMAFDTKHGFSLASSDSIGFFDVVSQATFPQLACDSTLDVARWFDSYLSTLLQSDIRAIAEIEKAQILPSMLRILAARVGGLLNDSASAVELGLNPMTFRRYRALLEAVFILQTVPPWYSNLGKRLVKSPKMYINDSLALCHLLGVQLRTLHNTHPELFGKVVENFVANELSKLLSFYKRGTLFHYRTTAQAEIDFLVEDASGNLVAIEVKTKHSVSSDDFKTILALNETYPTKLIKGIVFYMGDKVLPFGYKYWALPLSMLWN